MPELALYFQAHQPNRLKPYTFFDIGRDPFYEDDELNRDILHRVSDSCYIPANRLFMELADTLGDDFKLTYSLSGVFLEQLEHHRPDVLASFQDLVATGSVELLCETYYHALSFRASGEEFARQVVKQQETLDRLFGVKPKVFRHTELIYFNEIAAFVEELGFEGMLGEGVPHLLNGRSPNVLYQAPNVKSMKTMLRNNPLSDDVAFRFADPSWEDYPLTPERYAKWIAHAGGDVVGVFLDYETIGEHIGCDKGVFDFWRGLPAALKKEGVAMTTPSEAIGEFKVAGEYDAHEVTSWADSTKDLSAWKSNAMQAEAKAKILSLEKAVKSHQNPELLHQWSKMQTSDHYYYMFTKGGPDGAVHDHFSPYPSPYDAYLYFMNALSDLQVRVGESFD